MSTNFPMTGSEHAGFTVIDYSDIPELNFSVVRLQHLKTGAQHLHIANDDPNNLFAVSFRTPPADSTGVAHILEHTVLCGSHRFPVRDPFFAMLKRSLNTFMNALTASDWTCYPFSSQNRKDFDNLLGIYLDATFFPLLRELDFRQEGHRLEFINNDPDQPLTIQGVVYNEMKGAMASPVSLLGRRLGRALYPSSTYRHNSGGEPSEIPNLTWDELKEFHRRHYHPSNSWFFTYGSFPLQKHLEKIDELALRHFEALKVDTVVAPEKRLAKPWRALETFPLSPDEDTTGKTMVQVAWLTNDIENIDDRLALTQLSSLLLGNPAAPLYRALLESGYGSNLAPGNGYHEENRTTYFAAGLQGTEPDKTEAIEELVLSTLNQIASSGFSTDRIDGVLQRFEFANREVGGDHYPYPLSLCMRLLGSWLHANDPISPLQLEDNLSRLRTNLHKPEYLSQLIRRYLVDNPHRVTLTLKPDQEQQKKEDLALNKYLEEVRKGLKSTDAEKLIEKNRQLQLEQESESDLSCLPTLSREDIPAKEIQIPSKLHRVEKFACHTFPQPTNGIGYLNLAFSANDMTSEEQMMFPSLGVLLTQLGAGDFSYTDMAERMERYTGGIHFNCELLEDLQHTDQCDCRFLVKGKVLYRYQENMLDILVDLLTKPDFSDLDRIRTVLGQVRTSLENSIPGSGHSYAARAAAAPFSYPASLREQWSGITQIRHIRELCKLSPEALQDKTRELSCLVTKLFNNSSLDLGVTAEDDALSDFLNNLPSLFNALPDSSGNDSTLSNRQPVKPLFHGFSSSLPVAYCAKVFATVPMNHSDAPALQVLAKLLRSGFLHREIREKGGAYGGMAGYNCEGGLFSLLSYRDPNISRTLKVFFDAAEWAAAGKFSDQEIDEAVLATFSDLDRPLSPGGRGTREFLNILQALSPERRQQFRSDILSMTREKLKRAAEKYLVKKENQSSVAVLANSEMLKSANLELDRRSLEIQPL